MERDDEIKTFAYRYTELCYTSSLWLIFTDFTFVELSLCFKVLSQKVAQSSEITLIISILNSCTGKTLRNNMIDDK